MRRVVVVTDSSACLPDALVKQLGIVVLPISKALPDEERERADLGEGADWQLPQEIEAEELAGASHPFVTEYLAAIEAPGYEAAIVITPAIEFADMYRNAALAAELAVRPARSIDARTAAAGQALVVLAGARAAARDADLDEVVRIVESAAVRVELVASLATLEPLRRSGPVPDEVLGEGASGQRSVFRMHHGTVEPLDSGGSPAENLLTIRDTFRSSTHGVESSAVFHAGAHDLAARLESLLGGVDFVSGFSIAMQVHTGRGVVGAAWLPRRALGE